MKALGKLSHFAKSGKMLLRGGEVPALYSSVITVHSKHVGKVVDVIGPVSNPYVVVKPESKITEKELSSTKLYEVIQRKRRRSVGGKKGRVHRKLPGVQQQKPDKGLRKGGNRL